ncbi:response regulator [Paenibacillus macerans]|uniref:Helix-turn-helix domain protein n=2 Tax=Paenibacillus TaxID=44249 RepID=A0A090ZES5_PAEMA|nr:MULTISPECIES: helix-turn-helix domain-containing protein [Paenibacillus]KFN09107.1 helix-turn-helix domain protein [Paenibacillus macerans]MBS5912173.1 response regulator [Paenibacillus macerans]MCY7561298.1 response regulator [Paenibacillus macerans]MDU5949646.1 response regulator [Paenibacillus macerans]MEC0137398.1 response regulator [Paenibacillus macerans]
MRLLIVDDEPLILGGLVKVIKDAAPLGTEVREAGNAFEALEVMKGYMPDVTVTDLHMPEKNGFELMEEAKESGLCDRFIILTGYDDFEYVRRALRWGVVDYLLKPLDKNEIAGLLTHIDQELPSEADSECERHTKRILAYTEQHYMNDLSLDHLAELMNLHPNYISSLFKKVTGDTFVNYLNAFRIKEAQKLLGTHRHLSVSEIGRRVGFESKHYFAKVFKKYTGITPGAYRERDETAKDRDES